MFHIKYLTSKKEYVSQTGESLKLGFHEQLKYTTTHNLHLVHALHVLNYQHQHGPFQDTVELRTPARKSTRVNSMVLCHTHLLTTGPTNNRTELWHIKSLGVHSMRHATPKCMAEKRTVD
jgi:hypothetical protein